MASETGDPIDWSYPPPYTGQCPLSSTYCTVQCGLQIKTLAALSEVSRERATFEMPGQRTACAATQGRTRATKFSGLTLPPLCHLCHLFATSVIDFAITTSVKFHIKKCSAKYFGPYELSKLTYL